MISEYFAAKSEAMAAKAAGNKARQQHAGKLIRDLKAEMASLGAAKPIADHFRLFICISYAQLSSVKGMGLYHLEVSDGLISVLLGALHTLQTLCTSNMPKQYEQCPV